MGEYMLEHNIINLLNRDKDKSFTITEISSYLGVNNDEIIEAIKSLEENGIIFLYNKGVIYHIFRTFFKIFLEKLNYMILLMK